MSFIHNEPLELIFTTNWTIKSVEEIEMIEQALQAMKEEQTRFNEVVKYAFDYPIILFKQENQLQQVFYELSNQQEASQQILDLTQPMIHELKENFVDLEARESALDGNQWGVCQVMIQQEQAFDNVERQTIAVEMEARNLNQVAQHLTQNLDNMHQVQLTVDLEQQEIQVQHEQFEVEYEQLLQKADEFETKQEVIDHHIHQVQDHQQKINQDLKDLSHLKTRRKWKLPTVKEGMTFLRKQSMQAIKKVNSVALKSNKWLKPHILTAIKTLEKGLRIIRSLGIQVVEKLKFWKLLIKPLKKAGLIAVIALVGYCLLKVLPTYCVCLGVGMALFYVLMKDRIHQLKLYIKLPNFSNFEI